MTREELYAALKEKHDKTNWDNYEEVRAYNEYARTLRSIFEWEKED